MPFDPRAPGIAAGLALGAVAPVAALAYTDFAGPIGVEHRLIGSGVIALMAFGGPVLAIVGLRAASDGPRARGRATTAWILAVVAIVAFAFASARVGYVDRERIVYAMPIVGELVAGGHSIELGKVSAALRVDGASNACRVELSTERGVETNLGDGTTLSYCPPVRVRRDSVNDVAVIESLPLWSSPYSSSDTAWHRLSVVSTSTGRAIPLDAHTLRATLRIPPAWAALAAFSAAAAMGLLLVARRLRARASELASLSDAEHEGDGWFAFADGRRLRAASAAVLAAGAFTVRVSESPRAPTYRTSASVTVEPIRAGTTKTNADRAGDLGASCECIALAIAAIGQTPALAALIAFIPSAVIP